MYSVRLCALYVLDLERTQSDRVHVSAHNLTEYMSQHSLVFKVMSWTLKTMEIRRSRR